MAQFDREASQTRDYCVAKYATHRAARPDPSPRKERLLGMTIKLSHYRSYLLTRNYVAAVVQFKIQIYITLRSHACANT